MRTSSRTSRRERSAANASSSRSRPTSGLGGTGSALEASTGALAQVERRILLEDAAMQLAKLCARLQPELVVHPPPKLGVVVERVGLATGAIERQHREALHALPQGLVSGHRERIGKHLVVPAELQRRVEPRLQRDEPKLLEPLRLGAREIVVHHVGVGGAAPERERAFEVRARERGVPLRQRLDSVVVKTLEPVGVEGPVVEAEHVPARSRRERVSARQRLAELGDVDLQQLSGRRGWRLAPDRVDERVRGTCLSTCERQGREQPPVLRRRQLDRSVLAGDLERPKNT